MNNYNRYVIVCFQEDDLDCGGSTHVAPSILLLFIALQVTWLHIKLGFTGS